MKFVILLLYLALSCVSTSQWGSQQQHRGFWFRLKRGAGAEDSIDGEKADVSGTVAVTNEDIGSDKANVEKIAAEQRRQLKRGPPSNRLLGQKQFLKMTNNS